MVNIFFLNFKIPRFFKLSKSVLGSNDSQETCIHKCIADQYNIKYQCLPNPFIWKQFKLINLNENKQTICDRNQTIKGFNKIENICKNNCTKDCNEVYFTTRKWQ